MAALYWIELADPTRGKTFVDAVLTGNDGEQSLKITDVRYLLREGLIRNFSTKREYLSTFAGRNITVSVTFRSYRDWLLGKQQNRIKFTMSEKYYPWPEGAPYVVK
jgi:hypothetical protein